MPLAVSSVSAAPPILPALSPAQRLYSDALISVFGFLDLRGVISAHASCRSWRNAAHKDPSRSISFCCEPARLSWFCASPLRHHVGKFFSSYLPCTLDQFASLRAFPSLTRGTIRLDLSSRTALAALHGHAGDAQAVAATVAQWPSRLSHLNIILPEDPDESRIAEAQAVLDCVGRLGTLTELELRLPKLHEGSLTLQPLLQLAQLQTLQLDGGYPLGAADSSVLKQMGSLTHLDLRSAKSSLKAVQALCTPPHQLTGLQRIDLSGYDTVARMEALLHLPALSTLSLEAMDLAATAFLPRFTQLRTLELYSEVDASHLMPHLAQCTQLTALNIGPGRFTPADLTELTRSLTALTSLTFQGACFDGLDQPSALSCLRSLPQLRELQFGHCTGVRLAHLKDAAFTSLSSLRSLDVSLPGADLSEARSFFALPCKLMPQLTDVHFENSD